DGMSIREIAQTFGHLRRRIREALAHAEPRPYTLSLPRPRRVLSEAHQQWIDATLTADEQATRKQRHTATQLFRRLRDEEQYVGGYDQVRRYVAATRGRQRETFLPLSYEPGQRPNDRMLFQSGQRLLLGRLPSHELPHRPEVEHSIRERCFAGLL